MQHLKITTITAIFFTALLGVGLLTTAPTSLEAQEEAPRIVVYGDSLIAGPGVSSSFNFPSQLERLTDNEYNIINRGQNGAETEILLNNLEARVLSENPDIVILFGGGADLIPDFDNDGRVPAEETFENLREIIDRLQDEDITVILLGHGSYDIPGYTFVDYTSGFRNLAQETDVYFVPDATGDITLDRDYTIADRIHPNARGYSYITLKTFPVFQEAIYEEFPDAPLVGSCQVRIESRDRAELVFETDETVMTNQSVEWGAFVVGGFGNYRYDWEIDGEEQSGRHVTQTFDTEGNRTAEFTVTSRNNGTTREETIDCAQTIEVITPPLKGACRVGMNLGEEEVQITWEAGFSGGEDRDEYEWEWKIDGDIVSTDSRFTQTYDRDDTGTKSATVSVDSGPHDADLTCSTHIPDEDEATGTTTLRSISCDVEGYDLEIGDRIAWEADVSPHTRRNSEGETIGSSSFSWSGSNSLSTTSQQARIAYSSDGIKTARADIDAVTGEETFVSCEAKIVPDTDGRERGHGQDGEGCFIATAAFGTALAAEIDVLRNFRDEVLMTSPLGRNLVSFYYQVSPPLADVIADSPMLRQLTRWGLQPVITVAGQF